MGDFGLSALITDSIVLIYAIPILSAITITGVCGCVCCYVYTKHEETQGIIITENENKEKLKLELNKLEKIISSLEEKMNKAEDNKDIEKQLQINQEIGIEMVEIDLNEIQTIDIDNIDLTGVDSVHVIDI